MASHCPVQWLRSAARGVPAKGLARSNSASPSDVASVSACERLLSAGQKLGRDAILAEAHDPVLRMATAHSSRVFAGCTS